MLVYCPLESYPERYTFQLKDWTVTRLIARQIPFQIVYGEPLAGADHIRTGVALDAHGRSHYALTQTARLVAMLDRLTDRDVIYFQDLFQPGYEALPYIFDQLPPAKRPRIYTHNLAQSIDPNDFTFPMRHWMRHYELLVDQTVTGIFVASTCQVEMMRAALFNAPVHVVGLAFDRDEVRRRVPVIPPLDQRARRIVFSSRWDREKQPGFFMDLVETIKRQSQHPLNDYEFAVLTGSKRLRSNEPDLLDRAHELAARGWLTLYEGLSKDHYYALLADSRAQINTALQDFVSNTLNESSALGTPTLAPAYLSFPEALQNNRRQLYVPWSLTDAIDQLTQLVLDPPPADEIARPSLYHHGTLDRVLDVIEADDV